MGSDGVSERLREADEQVTADMRNVSKGVIAMILGEDGRDQDAFEVVVHVEPRCGRRPNGVLLDHIRTWLNAPADEGGHHRRITAISGMPMLISGMKPVHPLPQPPNLLRRSGATARWGTAEPLENTFRGGLASVLCQFGWTYIRRGVGEVMMMGAARRGPLTTPRATVPEEWARYGPIFAAPVAGSTTRQARRGPVTVTRSAASRASSGI